MEAVLATDGSDASNQAMRVGHALLPAHATRHLVTVIPPEANPNEDTTGFAGPLIGPEEATEQHVADVISGDGRVAAAARAIAPVPMEQCVLEGEPGREICALAATIGADVVVVGTRHSSPVTRAVLGSVSAYVVHHAPCPVLVVPAEVTEAG
jgi:nucleotide-binding universal stress UspA family protein